MAVNNFDDDIAKQSVEIFTKVAAGVKDDTLADAYTDRAFAICLNAVDKNVDNAISDCSIALQIATPKSEHASHACAVRAYAYYIKRDFISSQNDCTTWKSYSTTTDENFIKELEAAISSAGNDSADTVQKYFDIVSLYSQSGNTALPSLLNCEQYRELRGRLQNGW